MAFERPGGSGLDYQLCRYGQSRLLFRGPRARLVPPYTLFLGGTETFGRFVPAPFPDLVGARLGLRSVNMGCVNAGLDAYAGDATVLATAARAETVVIQIVGAHNLCNRFYSVHPRRNDRFVAAHPALRELYPEEDFTDYAFTRHLLGALERRCPARFAQVAAELQAVWQARMSQILAEAQGRAVLVWIADAPPPRTARSVLSGAEPLLVDAAMLAGAATEAAAVVEAVPGPAAREAGTAGMIFCDLDAPVAEHTLGPAGHADVAAALAPVLAARLPAPGAVGHG